MSPSTPLIPRAALIAVACCAAYGISSMSLSLVNKALLSSYNFKGVFTLLGCQMGFSYIVCVVSRDFMGNPFDIPKFSWPMLKKGALMGCLYVGNAIAGMIGLKLVSVPLFLCLRRLSPGMMLLVDYILYKKTADTGVQVSIFLAICGTVLAGYESFTAEWVGYAVTLLNNLITTFLAISQARFSVNALAHESPSPTQGATAPSATAASAPSPPPKKISVFGILYVNSIIATPLAFAVVVLAGEVSYIASFEHLHSGAFQFGFLASSAMAIFLTYSAVLCTTRVSPLAYLMTGQVKDLFATAIGWMQFGGFEATAMSVSGLALSFVGATIFSYTGLMKSRREAAAAAAAKPATADQQPAGTASSSDADSNEADDEAALRAPNAGAAKTAITQQRMTNAAVAVAADKRRPGKASRVPMPKDGSASAAAAGGGLGSEAGEGAAAEGGGGPAAGDALDEDEEQPLVAQGSR